MRRPKLKYPLFLPHMREAPETATLHVDLVLTDLEDFVEHVNDALTHRPYTLVDWSVPAWFLFDDNRTLEEVDAGYLKMTGGQTTTRQGRAWQVRTSQDHHATHTWSAYWEERDTQPKVMWRMTAVRFRRDRLKVYLYEYEGKKDQAERLHNWLIARWGEDGVIDRRTENAPPASTRPFAYMDTDVKATIVDYLIKTKGKTQVVACDFVEIAPRTYRNHRNKRRLLSDAEFERRFGRSVAAAAAAYVE